MKQLSLSASYYFFFLSLSASFFSFFLSSLFLGASLVFSFFNPRREALSKKNKWFFFFLTLPFIFTLISTAQSSNLTSAFDLLLKKTPFLMCPFILFKFNKLKSHQLRTFKIFITIPVLFIALEGVINGFIFYFEKGLFFPQFAFNHIFRIQHTYLALYLLFCTILWFFSKPHLEKHEKIFAIIVASMTIIVVVLVKARFAFFFLLFSFFLFVLKRASYSYLIPFLLAIAVSFFFMGDKFHSILSGNEARILFWECAISLINNNTFFSGIPVGDLQELLNSCYYNETMQLGFENKNTHNQLLDLLVTGGIFAFLLYCYVAVKVFISHKPLLFRLPFILIFIMSLTENIFERQFGILFICICISLTFIYSENENNRNRHWLRRPSNRDMLSRSWK